MRIEMQTESFPLGYEVRHHISHRLLFALSSHNEKIEHIKVLISDINGSHNGIDKHCQIQIVLHQLPDVVIENEGDDMFEAIELAVDTTSQTLDEISNHHGDWIHSASLSKFQVPSELGGSLERTHLSNNQIMNRSFTYRINPCSSLAPSNLA